MHLNYLPGFIPFHGHIRMNQENHPLRGRVPSNITTIMNCLPSSFLVLVFSFLASPSAYSTPLSPPFFFVAFHFAYAEGIDMSIDQKLLEETANQIYTFQTGYVSNHSHCQSMFHHFKPAYGQLEVVRKIVEEHGERRFLVITGWGFLRSNQKQPSPCP